MGGIKSAVCVRCSELLSSAETLVYRDDNIEEYDRLVIDNRRRQVIVGARFTYLLTYLLIYLSLIHI